MFDVNWDEVADEASDSPRAILAEVLARVDDITAVVIVFETEGGIQNTWRSTPGAEQQAIAMLEYAKWALLRDVSRRV